MYVQSRTSLRFIFRFKCFIVAQTALFFFRKQSRDFMFNCKTRKPNETFSVVCKGGPTQLRRGTVVDEPPSPERILKIMKTAERCSCKYRHGIAFVYYVQRVRSDKSVLICTYTSMTYCCIYIILKRQ